MFYDSNDQNPIKVVFIWENGENTRLFFRDKKVVDRAEVGYESRVDFGAIFFYRQNSVDKDLMVFYFDKKDVIVGT